MFKLKCSHSLGACLLVTMLSACGGSSSDNSSGLGEIPSPTPQASPQPETPTPTPDEEPSPNPVTPTPATPEPTLPTPTPTSPPAEPPVSATPTLVPSPSLRPTPDPTPTPSATPAPTIEPSPTPQPTPPLIGADCEALLTDPQVNWRDSALQSDQEIVECLKSSLGSAVGFGERATGGYDPEGNSNLVIITKDNPAQQLFDAVSSEEYNWIVFDKVDFSEQSAISMHSLQCENAEVLEALQITDNDLPLCRDPFTWCEAKNVEAQACLNEFYNLRLNNSNLPIRNVLVNSNTTIDGRGAKAFFLFNGFTMGTDSSGAATFTTENVIITNNLFLGAGHIEDHDLDPDMLRVTGESHDVWIHQNTFQETGDAAFDVKVGGFNTTISFNKLIDVRRASLHGSNDSREINAQITTTIHNNLFVTNRENYLDVFNGLRRVPLLRRGQSHIWNNVFYNYRTALASIRVGGRLLFQNNMVINNQAHSAQADITDLSVFLPGGDDELFDFREGGLQVENSNVWFGDDNCDLVGAPLNIDETQGETPDIPSLYSERSQNTLEDFMIPANLNLLAYLKATAGHGGEAPYLSGFAEAVETVAARAPESCLF